MGIRLGRSGGKDEVRLRKRLGQRVRVGNKVRGVRVGDKDRRVTVGDEIRVGDKVKRVRVLTCILTNIFFKLRERTIGV